MSKNIFFTLIICVISINLIQANDNKFSIVSQFIKQNQVEMSFVQNFNQLIQNLPSIDEVEGNITAHVSYDQKFPNIVKLEKKLNSSIYFIGNDRRYTQLVDILWGFVDFGRGSQVVNVSDITKRVNETVQHTCLMNIEPEISKYWAQYTQQVFQFMAGRYFRQTTLTYQDFHEFTQDIRETILNAIKGNLDDMVEIALDGDTFKILHGFVDVHEKIHDLIKTDKACRHDMEKDHKQMVRNVLREFINNKQLFYSTIHHLFHFMDVNGDHKLSVDEIYEFISVIHHNHQLSNKTKFGVKLMFDSLDINKDGFLELSELDLFLPLLKNLVIVKLDKYDAQK